MLNPFRRPATGAACLLAAAGLVVLTGCSSAPQDADEVAQPAEPLTVVASEPAPSAPAATQAAAPDRGRAPVDVPVAALTQRLRPDVLVLGSRTLSPGAVRKLAELSPSGGALAFRAGTVRIGGKDVKAIGIDPSTFRTFAAEGTAEATAVWQSIARGEAVASHDTAKALGLTLGKDVALAPSATGTGSTLRLGALATTGVPGSDLIVDDATARALGLPSSTAMLLTAGKDRDPVALAEKVRQVTGKGAVVDLLTPPAANPVAFLTGSRAAKAFGAFSYRYFPDGTIQPDSRWVRENIRTETLPIMGRVTCHRLMLTQLRGALQDVVDAGLASSLTTYDGCYVPRFIERNPENSISLHTWGIAIDMDASTNYRGIQGTMHPEVVNIFKRWGFRWGCDWKYTDPMHFELAALLKG
ncbi:MAG: family peptidase [Frankiales bacterium]|nr:family peptidase [Frankiales bacterium]